MSVTPQTEIRLLRVPFELDNKNQLTFANKQAQTDYFLSLSSKKEDNCSYQRKDNVIRFPAHIDSILTYNYVMYQNENYTNKWFYAFITNMKYMNDNMTEITIETDVFQTWQFDIIYKRMFVEREHVSDDTIGLHTIPENLDVGEVIEEVETEDISLSEYFWIAIETSWLPDDNTSEGGKQFAEITIYNKTVFGNMLLLFPINDINDYIDLGLYIIRTNNDKHIADIQNIFIIPDALVEQKLLKQHTTSIGGKDFSFYTMSHNDKIAEFTTTIDKLTKFNDYTPKNKKCFVYPYNYLLVSNNIGNVNIFKYENFMNQNSCTFKTQLAMSVGCSGRLVPQNYKKMSTDDDEILPLAKYPTCAWSSDAFVNWLTQNAVNESINMGLNAVGIGSSMKSENANPVSIGTNIAGEIGRQIGNFYSASLLPNIQGGQAVGDITWAANRNTFTFRQMRAKTEYLKVIDDFFSMYGYKVNSVKVPNITGRTNWNYVKTINANILGNIPQEDIQELKNILDNGVTFWHNPSTFLDYSQSNT